MDFPRIFDLEEACPEEVNRIEMIRRFQAAGTAASTDGAEVLLAAGGVVMALLADSGIDQTEDGTPVLNGIAALVKQGEVAVKLASQMNGPYTSKRLSHAAPSENDNDGYC